MPLDPISVGGIIRVSLLSAGIVGTGSSQLCLGLTNALCTYSKSAMVVTTIDVGTLGVGKGIGAGVILPQPVLAAALAANLPANMVAGLSVPQLVLGISTGYSMALMTAIINTMHPSVGVGSGKLQIYPNTAAAIGIFTSAFLAAGMTGPSVVPLATAVARSLDAVLPTAIGVVVIAGPPNIVPGAGVGSGKLV